MATKIKGRQVEVFTGVEPGVVPPSGQPVGNVLFDNGTWAQGQAGLSAYQIAVNNGFVGSESQWIISLQGNSKLVIDEPVTGVIDGSNAIFTVQNLFSANKFALYLNGVLQRLEEDYQISGQKIILIVSPSVGEKITVSYIIL